MNSRTEEEQMTSKYFMFYMDRITMSMIKATSLSYMFTDYILCLYGPLHILFEFLQEPPTEFSFHMTLGLPNINRHLTAFQELSYVICIISGVNKYSLQLT
jgi:hypothetical protein